MSCPQYLDIWNIWTEMAKRKLCRAPNETCTNPSYCSATIISRPTATTIPYPIVQNTEQYSPAISAHRRSAHRHALASSPPPSQSPLSAMFQFLSLICSVTSPLLFLRRARQQLQNLQGPSARPWAARPLDEPPYYGTRRGLELDLWHERRDELTFDYWTDLREQLKMDRPKTALRGVPDRRQFLLEELDGGESLDGVSRRRGRPSRNSRAFKVGTDRDVQALFGNQS